MPEELRAQLDHTTAVEYAIAWTDERHMRHLGRARVEDGHLVLEGTPPGGVRRTLRIPVAGITGVGLNRWRPAPAVAVGAPDGEVVVELLLDGWGAAHQLQNAIASARDAPRTGTHGDAHPMTDRIAVLPRDPAGQAGRSRMTEILTAPRLLQ
jgi:hypothetical protein